MIDVANESKQIYKSNNVNFIKGTLDELKLNKQFDIIIFSNVIHLLTNLDTVLNLALQKLKRHDI
jgi:2-polyprenyl-3-methyl-5-hydroxy-6-metoxy-1,4-benzoquinol methylase